MKLLISSSSIIIIMITFLIIIIIIIIITIMIAVIKMLQCITKSMIAPLAISYRHSLSCIRFVAPSPNTSQMLA